MESHFSVISWEYDEVRGSLAEFSLEVFDVRLCVPRAARKRMRRSHLTVRQPALYQGVLHCEQFKRLQDMKHSSALCTLDILSCPFQVKRT
jgi:hypothetical protein